MANNQWELRRCGSDQRSKAGGQKLNLAIIYKVMFGANMLGSILREKFREKENGYTEFGNHQY